MKFILAVLAVTVAVVVARPQKGGDADATIGRLESSNDGLGSYSFAFDTSNGIQEQESGQVKNLGPEDQPVVSSGSFSWTAPDGQKFTVTWVADENGFQPQGDHLPKAP